MAALLSLFAAVMNVARGGGNGTLRVGPRRRLHGPAEALRSVIKFVLFTDPTDDEYAPMHETVEALRAALEGTGATVLDCGARQCEV